jgi:hypothetical protein
MFTEYDHMENEYRIKKRLNKLISTEKELIENGTQLTPQKYYITEKIHGTNYSFICNGIDVIPCKRSSIITENTSFFNHNIIFNRYKKYVLVLFEELKKKYDNLQQIQLYGELFGGNYNGKTAASHVKIQKNVNYHNENQFMAYDLYITLKDVPIKEDSIKEDIIKEDPAKEVSIKEDIIKEDTNKKSFYMDFCDLIEIIKLTKIKLVPIINCDTLENVLKYNPKFESIVYTYYGLPMLPNNYAEGYVIKPEREKTIMMYRDKLERFIFKFKNPDFLETGKEIIAEDGTVNKKLDNVQKSKMYITHARYDNVITKLTDTERKNKEIVDKAFYNDIWKDYRNDLKKDDIVLTQKESSQCSNMLNKLIKNNYFYC